MTEVSDGRVGDIGHGADVERVEMGALGGDGVQCAVGEMVAVTEEQAA